MKDIVIIANFCRDFSVNDNGRFMYLCKELSKNNNVEIITSDFRHTAKKHKDILRTVWPFKITFLHELGYKKNISIRRFISHYFWGVEVNKYLKNRVKPDVVYCAVPSLTGPLKTAKFCKKNRIHFIIDIQDLWPEAFQMVFNIPILSSILFFPFKCIANGIYKRADDIIGVSKTYVDRAVKVNKNCKSGYTVFLGTDLKKYDENKMKLVSLNKEQNEIWIAYCGSLSVSYDISCLIKAVSTLKFRKYNNLKLIIMGEGALRKVFEEEARKEMINVIFTGYLPYDQMCSTLNLCDIVVNPIKSGSAASIINKHGDYAASGLPVINTQDSLEYRNLIDFYHMGFNCVNGNPIDMADKIEILINNYDTRIEMGDNARKCAKMVFDREYTYKTIINLIEKSGGTK